MYTEALLQKCIYYFDGEWDESFWQNWRSQLPFYIVSGLDTFVNIYLNNNNIRKHICIEARVNFSTPILIMLIIGVRAKMSTKFEINKKDRSLYQHHWMLKFVSKKVRKMVKVEPKIHFRLPPSNDQFFKLKNAA